MVRSSAAFPADAEELRRRLERFQGIGQKKAAMAVEILERQRGVEVNHLEGSDVAFDVHVRRVFSGPGSLSETTSATWSNERES